MSSNLPLTAPDLVCIDDMTLGALETTSDLQSLSQDVYHTLIEDPGSNLDDPTRGIGIEGLLSSDANNLAGVAQRIETGLLKDDRVDGVSATISQIQPGQPFSDGTLAPSTGGYEIALAIQADASVIGLNYAYTPAGGLVPLQ